MGLIIAVIGCTNQEVEFDDFEYQTVYFPFQTPLRTIMLGDEVLGDNSIDLEHAFSVGAAMGGVYSNSKDRELTIQLAPELAANITDGDGNALQILPANYYDATLDKIIISAGSFSGKVRVNLTDAFFNDPLATSLNYVLPVRITEAKDSILQGLATVLAVSPDPRVKEDWTVAPKDYVLFGIKYINPTHGVYLLRGKRTNIADNTDSFAYSERFIDDNEMTKLTTKSLTENFMPTVGGTNKEGTDAKYSMKLTFNDANNSIIVSQKDDSSVVVNGTGTYYSKDDNESEGYNGKQHRTIYLDYTYEDAGVTYKVNDSLVFVDTDMKFEEFSVEVNN